MKNNQSIHTSSVKEQKCYRMGEHDCPGCEHKSQQGMGSGKYEKSWCIHCKKTLLNTFPSPSVSESLQDKQPARPLNMDDFCQCGVLKHRPHVCETTSSLPVQAESQAKEEDWEKELIKIVPPSVMSVASPGGKTGYVDINRRGREELKDFISHQKSLSFQQGFLEGQAKAAEEIFKELDNIQSDIFTSSGSRIKIVYPFDIHQLKSKYLSFRVKDEPHEKEESK